MNEPSPPRPARGRITGHYAGPLSRILAFMADMAIIVVLFSITAAVITYVIDLFSTSDVHGLKDGGWIWVVLFCVFWFLYFWAGLTLAGRTPGKALVGLRVVSRNGVPLTPRQGFFRVLVLPISIVSVIGLIGGLIGRERRALQDVAARSVEVYDWGDRPAELPGPLTRWLADRPEAPLKLPDTPAGVSAAPTEHVDTPAEAPDAIP